MPGGMVPPVGAPSVSVTRAIAALPPGSSVVSQFEFLVPLHQEASGQTETLPAHRVH